MKAGQQHHGPYASIVRGTMASDHYTQVHNLIARGQVLPVRYVGVWTHLVSHQAGWTTGEKALAKQLGVGRDYVRAALRAMEEAQLLVRARLRDPDSGRLASSVWFVSDLAAQLKQVGIEDKTAIADAVAAAWREYQNSSSSLMSGNATLVGTHAKRAQGQKTGHRPSLVKTQADDVDPGTGIPPEVATTANTPNPECLSSSDQVPGNPTPKKTSFKKTKTPPLPPAADPAAARPQDVTPGDATAPTADPPAADMAAVAGLATRLAHTVGDESVAGHRRVCDALAAGLRAGWDTERLYRHLTAELPARISSGAGLLLHRLADLGAPVPLSAAYPGPGGVVAGRAGTRPAPPWLERPAQPLPGETRLDPSECLTAAQGRRVAAAQAAQAAARAAQTRKGWRRFGDLLAA